MTDHPAPSDGASLAHSLVSVAAQLHGILSHMDRTIAAGRSPADAPPPPVVLESLLDDCLAPLVERDPVLAELMAAALDEIGAIVEEEIFLVRTPPPPRPLNRTERRRRRC